jgi:glycosyltransferase involved in cell wall biosynthesis
MAPPEVGTRERKTAQFLKSIGHEVINVGSPVEIMTDTPLLSVDPVDDCETFHMNVAHMDLVLGGVAALKPDVIHCHMYECLETLLGSTIPGDLWHVDSTLLPELPRPKQLENVKLVYDAAEFERSRMLWQLNQEQFWRRDRRLKGYLKCHVDKVFAVSPGVAKRMVGGYDLRVQPEITPNSPFQLDGELEKGHLRRVLKLEDDKPIVAFCGFASTLRLWHQAALACRDLGYTFVMITAPRPGSPGWNEAMHIMRGCQGQMTPLAEYPHPGAHRPHLLDWLCDADVGFNGSEISYFENNLAALPNKFFEYAWAGLPIVSSPSEDIIDIVDTYKVGVIYDNTIADLRQKLECAMRMKEEVDFERFRRDWCFEVTAGAVLEKYYAV